MHEAQKIECLGCGSNNVSIEFNEKYHGLRGSCPDCGSNWPES